MDWNKYQQILRANITESVKKLKLKRGWFLQKDKDPKHTSKSTVDNLKRSNSKDLNWPSWSPDLNIIENLWIGLLLREMNENQSNKNWKTLSWYKECWQLLDNIPFGVPKNVCALSQFCYFENFQATVCSVLANINFSFPHATVTQHLSTAVDLWGFPLLRPDLGVAHRSHSSPQRSPEDSSSYSRRPLAGSSLHGDRGWSGMGYSPL